MPKPKSPRVLPPLRVRQEPPTVEDAIVAAQALTPDLDQQVEIAAGLMGLGIEAIRPSVLKARPLISSSATGSPRGSTGSGTGTRPVGPVVVERRSRLPLAAAGSSRPMSRPYQRD
jgi:hypothetical protein